jgi:hypothetical protein
MSNGPLAQITPAVLDDVKIVVLNRHLAEHGADSVIMGLTAIDIKGTKHDPQPSKALQKRLDAALIAFVGGLGGQNAPVLVFYHQHALVQPSGKRFRPDGLQ